MASALEQLSQIDWWSFLITLAVVICAYIIIKEGLEKFFKIIGYTPKYIKYREEQTNAIESLKQQMEEYQQNRLHDRQQSFEIQKELVDAQKKLASSQKDLMDCFTTVSKKLDVLQKNIDDNELRKRIDGLRSAIIGFATSLGNSQFRPSLDHYNNIFAKVEEYEEVLEQHGLENGQTDVSVKIIKKHYEESLERGDFLKAE